MLLDRSPTVDLDPSKVQVPVSAASANNACNADAFICPDGAMPSSRLIQF